MVLRGLELRTNRHYHYRNLETLLIVIYRHSLRGSTEKGLRIFIFIVYIVFAFFVFILLNFESEVFFITIDSIPSEKFDNLGEIKPCYPNKVIPYLCSSVRKGIFSS